MWGGGGGNTEASGRMELKKMYRVPYTIVSLYSFVIHYNKTKDRLSAIYIYIYKLSKYDRSYDFFSAFRNNTILPIKPYQARKIKEKQ